MTALQHRPVGAVRSARKIPLPQPPDDGGAADPSGAVRSSGACAQNVYCALTLTWLPLVFFVASVASVSSWSCIHSTPSWYGPLV